MGSEEAKTFPAAQKISAVFADELGAEKESGPDIQVSDADMAPAKAWMKRYATFLADRADLYGTRLAIEQEKKRRGQKIEVGQPTVGPYVAWDILMFSPFELNKGPADWPNRIVEGGQLAIVWALMWTNPFADVPNGFAIPPTTQLIGKAARLTCSQFNLSTGAVGPNWNWIIPALPDPVPALVPIPFPLLPQAVQTPQMVEVNVTADIIGQSSPFAAFASWHVDIDDEPSWFAAIPPGQPGPRLHFDVPMRYMIYPK